MHHSVTEEETTCSKFVLKETFLSCHGMLLCDPDQIWQSGQTTGKEPNLDMKMNVLIIYIIIELECVKQCLLYIIAN
jgi:hypothetical protein